MSVSPEQGGPCSRGLWGKAPLMLWPGFCVGQAACCAGAGMGGVPLTGASPPDPLGPSAVPQRSDMVGPPNSP